RCSSSTWKPSPTAECCAATPSKAHGRATSWCGGRLPPPCWSCVTGSAAPFRGNTPPPSVTDCSFTGAHRIRCPPPAPWPRTGRTGMRVSVIGCGHLGAPHAAAMAELGHEVIGVELDPGTVKRLNGGRGAFYEEGLGA